MQNGLSRRDQCKYITTALIQANANTSQEVAEIFTFVITTWVRSQSEMLSRVNEAQVVMWNLTKV